jgi:hypothetical protein
MFLAWGEVLANKLEQILEREGPKHGADDAILTADDYYDEALVNPDGNNCPFALQNVVCILLLEITAFLRETYQYMPKKVSHTDSNTAQRMQSQSQTNRDR